MKFRSTETKQTVRTFVLGVVMLVLAVLLSKSVLADEAGWQTTGKKVYYNISDGSGGYKHATGLVKIGKRYYLFSKSGVMKTGWQKTSEGYRYFKVNGGTGVSGRMYVGFQKLNGRYFYFDKKGVVKVGKIKYKGKYYFFNRGTKLGIRGRSIKNKWAVYRGVKNYYKSDFTMAVNCWVQNTYYVDSNGVMLTDTVTPDGYHVDEEGKKVGSKKVNGFVKLGGKYYYYDLATKSFLKSRWKTVNGNKYYLNADGVRVNGWQNIGKYRYYFKKGVRQTGLVSINGKNYYFNDENGRLLKNTNYNGYNIDANGVATRDTSNKARILIVAGHGQGDPGACSSWGQERDYTRQFAKLIYTRLLASGTVNVDFYKNGDLNYDLYQQNVRTLGSAGLNILSTFSGAGKKRSAVKKGIALNSNIPDLSSYDYVLEVHFNAKVKKDPQGDGSFTGIGFYVNSYKSSYSLERAILNKVAGLGFKIWGAGVYSSSSLTNAKVCTELGVDYALLETAFIDDGDDMTFYTKNKKKMATAVANCILSYFQ